MCGLGRQNRRMGAGHAQSEKLVARKFLVLGRKPLKLNSIHGSSRGIVGKYAACGWAMVQLDEDGGLVPWKGVDGALPVPFQTQRTGKTAEEAMLPQ